MKIWFFLSLLFFVCSPALSEVDGVEISPLYGLETVKKISPEVKVKYRYFVGLRLVYGPPNLAFEAEGTKSQDTENLPEKGIVESEEAYTVKLGLRSGVEFKYFNWYFRGGAQARKSIFKRTENNMDSKTEPDITVSPYAGTGFKVNINNNIIASGGVTVVFTGKPKGSDRDYQTTLSFGIKI